MQELSPRALVGVCIIIVLSAFVVWSVPRSCAPDESRSERDVLRDEGGDDSVWREAPRVPRRAEDAGAAPLASAPPVGEEPVEIEAPSEPTPPLDQAELERIESQRLSALFALEARDASWAYPRESELNQFAERSDAFDARSVECRATMCRLEIAHALGAQAAMLNAVGNSGVFPGETFVYFGDGLEERGEAVIYTMRGRHRIREPVATSE